MSFCSSLILPAALSALALSGCERSGTPAPLPVVGGYIPLNDTTSTDTSTLQAYELDSTNGTTSNIRGSLDRSKNAVDLGNLSGTMDATHTYVQLVPGGQLKLTYGAENYVAFYSTQPASGDMTTGVVGVPSDATQLPTSGSGTYFGEAQVGIIDGSSFYELTGKSSSTVNFGTSKVNTTLSALSGTQTDGTSSPTSVTNVVDLSINGAKMVNGAFSGGTASISHSTLSAGLSGSQVVNNSGNLYGPGGTEIGGVFAIDDTSGSGSLLLQGSYLGQQ